MFHPQLISAGRLLRIWYVERVKQTVPDVLLGMPVYRWISKSKVAIVILSPMQVKPYSFHCPVEMSDVLNTYWLFAKPHGVLNTDYYTFDDLNRARDRMINQLEEYVRS